MKSVKLTFSALALGFAALAPQASAQAAVFDWRPSEGPPGGKAAWAVKTEGGANELPQLMLMGHDVKPGPTPGSEIRSTQLITFEIDCTEQMGRPLSMTLFEDYAETGTRTPTASWVPFNRLGGGAAIARSYCEKAGPIQTAERNDIIGAMRWLDDQVPRKPIAPTGALVFEYGGPLNSTQPLDLWLETSTIKREGDTAKAWIFQVWEPGWQPMQARSQIGANPASWKLQEFKCSANLQTRTIWSVDLNGKLETTRSNDKYEQLQHTSDTTYGSIALRVCNKRPMLFSETLKGDIRTLVSKRYPGAGIALGLGATSYQDRPRPQSVDLGPTIRITQKDRNYSYVGIFTREAPESAVYSGQLSFPDGKNSYPAKLTVVGIVNGQLILRRNDTFEGQMAIPITNGKPTGKGVYAAFRHDDAFTWSLVEPSAIKPK